jgi:hypothetical protein
MSNFGFLQAAADAELDSHYDGSAHAGREDRSGRGGSANVRKSVDVRKSMDFRRASGATVENKVADNDNTHTFSNTAVTPMDLAGDAWIAREEIKVAKNIGQGPVAQVDQATYRDKMVAMKNIKLDNFEDCTEVGSPSPSRLAVQSAIAFPHQLSA